MAGGRMSMRAVTIAVLCIAGLLMLLLFSSHQNLLSRPRYDQFFSTECDTVYEIETPTSQTLTQTLSQTQTQRQQITLRIPRRIKISQTQAQQIIQIHTDAQAQTQTQTQKQSQAQTQAQTTAARTPALADGCHSVYLDLGTNIGVQMRKLYEPDLFPIAIIKPRFEDYFGKGDRKHVCSFGWEPNLNHVSWLSHEEHMYRSLGYRMHIFTTSGVYDEETIAEFVSDNAPQNDEWAGKVKPIDITRNTTTTPTLTTTNNKNTYQVHLFNFAQWFKTHIVSRSIPEWEIASHGPPTIMMKLDIEGPDWKVVTQLIRTGLWCDLTFVYQEHLNVNQTAMLDAMKEQLGDACKTKITLMDDETYHRARFPFPAVPAGAAATAAWLDRFPLPPRWDTAVKGPLPTHKPYDEQNRP